MSQLNPSFDWHKINVATFKDSDISVRRKTAFLLNTLLLPNTAVTPQPVALITAGPGNSTAATLHATAPENRQSLQNSDPVHPNSHASMLAEPSSFSTSELTRNALEQSGLLKALIDALVAPLPHGPDGDSEGDPELEEKIIKYVSLSLISLSRDIDPALL